MESQNVFPLLCDLKPRSDYLSSSLFPVSLPELRNGVPTLSISHGSGTLTLQLPTRSTITDRRWHRLDIISDGKVQTYSQNGWEEGMVGDWGIAEGGILIGMLTL